MKVADLRDAVEQVGLAEVATYIRSGNLLFSASRQKRDELAARMESELSRRFGMELKLVLVTHAELALSSRALRPASPASRTAVT